jgi:hypothetical protein
MMGPVKGFCEGGNELRGSMKDGKSFGMFLETPLIDSEVMRGYNICTVCRMFP